MNTITTTASTNTSILAIDLGKYKSVACVHDQATGRCTANKCNREKHISGARAVPDWAVTLASGSYHQADRRDKPSC